MTEEEWLEWFKEQGYENLDADDAFIAAQLEARTSRERVEEAAKAINKDRC